MKTIEYAIQLRKNGDIISAKEYLMDMSKDNPRNAEINYQLAWCCDLLELESEAIKYYQEAIENHLNKTELCGAYLGLGSTYRAVGKYLDAKKVLLDAIELFPDRNEFKIFLSMVYYNTKEYNLGYKILLSLIINSTTDKNILEYKNALELYKDDLDRIWS